MIDKISPIRQASVLMPKIDHEVQSQEKIVPNGNLTLEIEAQKKQMVKRSRIDEPDAAARVTIQSKRVY